MFRHWGPADRFPVLNDRFARSQEIVPGKEVLDCGCVGYVREDVEEIDRGAHAQILLMEKQNKTVLWNGKWEIRQTLVAGESTEMEELKIPVDLKPGAYWVIARVALPEGADRWNDSKRYLEKSIDVSA